MILQVRLLQVIEDVYMFDVRKMMMCEEWYLRGFREVHECQKLNDDLNLQHEEELI